MRTMYFYPFQLIFSKQPQNSATGWLDCGRQSGETETGSGTAGGVWSKTRLTVKQR
ncbi:hypothetical protein B0H12DRAFT_1122429 [Mycena haematopus]|nr:hypothetical protein B0H12DRAFT_1162077 [Mycena haematopus]KAJ7219849.1 hypothetical protein B0H12DRAFT_1152362 [Mycena haematopus]KAJ7249230.1 hypothetical protein B0H12DRAFT_1122429 [Mycena haematopus]